MVIQILSGIHLKELFFSIKEKPSLSRIWTQYPFLPSELSHIESSAFKPWSEYQTGLWTFQPKCHRFLMFFENWTKNGNFQSGMQLARVSQLVVCLVIRTIWIPGTAYIRIVIILKMTLLYSDTILTHTMWSAWQKSWRKYLRSGTKIVQRVTKSRTCRHHRLQDLWRHILPQECSFIILHHRYHILTKLLFGGTKFLLRDVS